MSLPILQHPIFMINVPSKNKEYKFRPFLVKEEKILLIGKEDGTDLAILNSIKQIINNCSIEEDLDVNNLTILDLEYIFLKLRSLSVNNIIELKYEDSDDGTMYEFELNLDDVKIHYDETHSKIVMINDEFGITMRYITSEDLTLIDGDTSEDLTIDIMRRSIENVFDNDNVYKFQESTKQEQLDFIDNLDTKTYENMMDFFRTIPRMTHILSYTNKLGTVKEIKLEKIVDFFTFR